MNDDSLDSLFSKARAAGPRNTAREEFGFETRLAARIASETKSTATQGAFAIWPWRLLPFFAIVAIFVAWNTWENADESELAIRSSLEDGAVEWAYVESLTGRTL